MDIKGRVALITGGKRIGQVVAQELAARGAHVALAYRGSRDEAEQAAQEVGLRGGRAVVLQADLAKPEDCERLIAETVEELGALDILVNMASVYGSTPFDDLTAEAWDRDLNINLTAAFLCAKAAIPHMRRAGGGRIVNFADWLARERPPGVSRVRLLLRRQGGCDRADRGAGARGGARSDSRQRDRPGPILPPPDLSDAESNDVAAATPVGRWGGALEIARAVIALVETDFITGETIRVDGGRHVK